MTKRKVGGVIIMHPGHNNYGTSLQGLATVRIIQDLGYDLRIIRYNKNATISETFKSLIGYIRSGAIGEWIKRWKRQKAKNMHPEYAHNAAIRTEKCNAFKNKYFEPLCDYYTGWKELTEKSKKYDVIFVGSDQVWSPLSLYTGFYNLMFVDEAVPQFSYSSSFGKSYIMEHQKKDVARFLNKMDAIGVREKRAVEIVKELTGRDSNLVADPTLLLSRQDWEAEIKGSDAKIEEPYILCYMLGPRHDNREMVTKIGKELSLKIVTFNHMDWYEPADENFGDIHNYTSDCLDFVKLLSCAEYVVTDSFHCTVFSIIFQKKFLTFYRLKPTDQRSSHSRIESLLSVTGLQERAVKLLDEREDLTSLLKKDPDWKLVNDQLKTLKNESMTFLKKCLEITKDGRF